MKYVLELTEEELMFLYDRCSRKAARLEEAHLEDIPCYRLSWQIMTKINRLRNNEEEK
jgi:hypothetical protein